MPIHLILTTPQEVFSSALNTARELSGRIMKLADLTASPLTPGETADARRHQIAKFGKALAEAFLVIDKLMEKAADELIAAHNQDVTSGPTKPPNDSNTN